MAEVNTLTIAYVVVDGVAPHVLVNGYRRNARTLIALQAKIKTWPVRIGNKRQNGFCQSTEA